MPERSKRTLAYPLSRRVQDPGIKLRAVNTKEDVHRSAELTAGTLASDDRERVYDLITRGLRDCLYMRPERSFLVEAQGKVIARLQLLDLDLQIGDILVPAVGLNGLVIEPHYSGRGLALWFSGPIMERVRADGALIMIGFTGTRGYYERFGGITVTPDYALTFEAPLQAQTGRSLRVMTPADLPYVLSLYRKSNAGRTGVLARTTERWPWLYRKSDLYFIGASGYAGVRVEGSLVHIDEVAGDDAFFDALVSELHLLVGARPASVRADVPPDHPFALHAARFGSTMETNLRGSGGGMAKIVNLKHLIKRLEPDLSKRYRNARGDAGALHLTLVTEEAEGVCVLGNREGATEKRRLVLPEGVLCRLVFGTLPAEALLKSAAVDLPANDLSLLTTIFPNGYPHTWRADRF